jgi:predicted metal-dependent phosphoesterase TrpH
MRSSSHHAADGRTGGGATLRRLAARGRDGRPRAEPYAGRVRIDLHTHSTASDGTDTPTGVVEAAARAALDVVALTDHDTTSGWVEAAAAARSLGIGLVPGTEVSCRSGGVSAHVLSYLQDPAHPALIAFTERTRAARLTRAHRIVELLASDYALSWDDVLEQAADDATVGRPHIADALVARGHVADRSAAFDELLRPGGPYYVPHYAPDVVEAVRAIRQAGGVPVFAHPGAAGRGRIVTDDVIATMARAGLAGLEIDHRDHDEAARARLRGLADELGLFTTGSSDYHGGGKENVIGENLTSPEVLGLIEAEGRIPVVRP